jgi:proteic killer suppression protein
LLKITYKNKKLERTCNDYAFAKKIHGEEMAILIHRRIDQITAADSVEMLVQGRIGRCHELKGNRKEEYAVVLKQPFRLVFKKVMDEEGVVQVIEIIDYH